MLSVMLMTLVSLLQQLLPASKLALKFEAFVVPHSALDLSAFLLKPEAAS